MALPWALTSSYRPDRINDEKNLAYHLQFARYCSQSLSNPVLARYYWNVWRNKLFVLGGDGQWVIPDDNIVFFEDVDGAARGRVRFVQNIIRPYVNQMVNEARKMSLTFKVQSQGDGVINRREKELVRMKIGRQLADMYPALQEHIKKVMPIGRDMEETEEIFRNVWTDTYEKTVNNLVKYIVEKNELDTVIREQISKNIAISGLGVIKNEWKGGELVPRVIDAGNFIFDAGCERYDFRDAEYMGDLEYALPTDLYERFEISKGAKTLIEQYTRQLPVSAPAVMPVPYSNSYLPGRLPVVYMEWRDTEQYKYGYVKDRYGYDYFTRVYKNNYKPDRNERVYYEKDLITPNNESYQRKMNGKLFKTLDVEVLRFARFTPSELYTGGEGNDIVYEWGVVPYQETYALDPTQTEFSYRCAAWDYQEGIISSPVDDIIDPQRLINRTNSMAEAAANKYTSGNIVDLYATKGMDITEEELQRKVERGETIVIDSKGMGAPQASSTYGSNAIQGAQALKMLAVEYEQAAQRMVGIVNVPGAKEKQKAVLGAEQEEQSLHGQYLARVEDLMKQEYQCLSNKGRRIYADSPRRLSIMVGDKGAQEIFITKDICLEDFRMFINRADDEKQSKTAGDMAMMQMFQAQLITEIDFANAFGRTPLNKVGDVFRESLLRKQTAQKAKQEQDAKNEQLQQMLSQANLERMELQKKQDQNIELSEAEKDRMIKLETIITRMEGQIKRDNVKHEHKMAEMAASKK